MRVRRLPCVDEYVEGGESAVLIGNRVFVLSPLATTLMATIGDDTVEVAHLAKVLADAFGEPPPGIDLLNATTEAVETLAAEGLVEMSDFGVKHG